MVKTLLKLVGALLGLVVVAVVGLLLTGSARLAKVRDLPIRPVAVANDSQAIARGRHLATVIMQCADCHGADFGGVVSFMEAGPMASVNTANLTSGEGGRLPAYDDATLARTIRHGIKADGRPILIMPAEAYTSVSDGDVAAVIAYLRTLPPVDRTIPPSRVKPLGKILYAAGQFPVVAADEIDHARPPAPDQTPAATAEYGRYLAEIGGCTACHGPGLSGGKIPFGPPDWRPATNITPEGLKDWTEGDFVTALKTGIRPNGVPIDSQMPWRLAGQMDSTELSAVWRFLQSAPPKAYGGR